VSAISAVADRYPDDLSTADTEGGSGRIGALYVCSTPAIEPHLPRNATFVDVAPASSGISASEQMVARSQELLAPFGA
jgi:hypothetical protein